VQEQAHIIKALFIRVNRMVELKVSFVCCHGSAEHGMVASFKPLKKKSKMTDQYGSYYELQNNHQEEHDYHIRTLERSKVLIILAIHGNIRAGLGHCARRFLDVFV